MNRRELIREVRRCMHGCPEDIICVTETLVLYGVWRNATSEQASKIISARVVERGRRVTDFLERHGMLNA